MRYKATLMYEGTSYFGYQIQPKEEEISIQEEIQKVLKRIFQEDIKIVSSGRTDRGVHALKQCFHFDLNRPIDTYKIKHSLNCLLPKDIYISSLEEVSEDFHARFSVVDKTYMYVINEGEYNPFLNDLVYNFNDELDVEKMKDASRLFVGEHSFHNFCSNDEDFVRTINYLTIERKNDYLIININGNGFRRYMVRMIVGTLIEVGLNKLSIEELKKLFDEEMNRVSYKAPASGLYLKDINYGGNNND